MYSESNRAENPYASPSAIAQPAATAEEPVPPKHGSLVLIILGFILLLLGYISSNVFAIADLYHVGFGPGGKFIPSPFADAFTTSFQQWLFYGVAASAAIVGCVLIGSQNFNPMAVVCYIMCPLIAIVFALGLPLRTAQRFAVPIATVYLAIGTCLAGAGIMRLVNLYGRPNLEFEPILASLLTEVGLAMLVGAILKLGQSGAFSATQVPAAGDYAAAR